ncbi:carbohydrate ABC transporter permease [Fictibacillus fluitans]
MKQKWNTQGKKKSSNKRKWLQALIFLLPSLLLLGIFFAGPIIMTFYFAFTDMSLTGASAQNIQYVGFQNFTNMFQDPSFKTSFMKTMVFLLMSAILGQQVLGFILAMLMREKNATVRRITGTAVIAGWVTPEIICAFAFVTFFSDNGTLNHLLNIFNFGPVSWLYTFPMAAVVIANIWHGTAYSMMMFQAALDGVPKEIHEAAMVDGAGRWQRLWRITIPSIKNTISTNLVVITLGTLGVFSLIYTMTGGGPANSTSTMPVFMYKQAFVNYQLGYGTAISLILLLIGITFSLLYIKFLKTDQE